MNRLSDTAIDVINDLHTERLDYNSEYLPLIDAAQRLAAYEDTGLEPEEIGDMKTAYDENQMPYMIEATGREAVHIHNLLLAEAQGRLVVLPCKVGDTVYEAQLIRKRIQPLEIVSISIGRMGGIFFNWELKDQYGIYQNVKGFGLSQLGKTVFLTREEAEKALEEMKQ